MAVVVREGFLSTVHLCASVYAVCLCSQANCGRKITGGRRITPNTVLRTPGSHGWVSISLGCCRCRQTDLGLPLLTQCWLLCSAWLSKSTVPARKGTSQECEV